MTRFLYLISALLLLSSCVPDTIRNRSQRQEIIANILGPQTDSLSNTNWEYKLQLDSIKEVRYDSIALKLAMELTYKYDSYHDLEYEFSELFPVGETNTTVEQLSVEQLPLYNKMATLLTQIVEQRASLVKRIKEFNPSCASMALIEETHSEYVPDYRKSETGHYFFFNEANDLVSHFVFKKVDGITINDVLNEFLKKDELVYKFKAYTFSNSVKNIDTVSDLTHLSDKSTPIQVYRRKQQPVRVPEYTSHESTVDYDEESSVFPSGANLYEVKKQDYGTSTREAYDRLIEYANANDLDGISSMIINGEITILNPGDKVMMLDMGFSVSKIKNKHGNIVFVDTGSIRKID